jgi:hypothetical protein
MLCYEVETLHEDFSSCELRTFERITFFWLLLLFWLELRNVGSSEPLAYLGRSMGWGITFFKPLLAPMEILRALPPEELRAAY